MQQDRNKSRRPSSSIQQNSARRQGKPRKAYDWTQDRRPSNQNRRRTQGYQEIDVQLRTSEHRSMYSYVRLSIDRCTATYV